VREQVVLQLVKELVVMRSCLAIVSLGRDTQELLVQQKLCLPVMVEGSRCGASWLLMSIVDVTGEAHAQVVMLVLQALDNLKFGNTKAKSALTQLEVKAESSKIDLPSISKVWLTFRKYYE
jgi:hypothetical protein